LTHLTTLHQIKVCTVLHNPAIFDLTPEVVSIGYSRNDNEEEDVDNGDETDEQDDESDEEDIATFST